MNKNNLNKSSDKNIKSNQNIVNCPAQQKLSHNINKELFLQIGEDNIKSGKLEQVELVNLDLLENNTLNGDVISEKEAKKLIKGNKIKIVKANCKVLNKDLNIIPGRNIMIISTKPNTQTDDSGDRMTNKQIIEILLEMKDDIKGLKEDVKGLKEDVKGLKEDMVQVKDRLTNLEGDVKALRKDFDNHMNKYHPESL